MLDYQNSNEEIKKMVLNLYREVTSDKPLKEKIVVARKAKKQLRAVGVLSLPFSVNSKKMGQLKNSK